MLLVAVVDAQLANHVCDFGPDGVTNVLDGYQVRQVCIDVPVEGASTQKRCYYEYIPQSCRDSSKKVPLVVNVHGLNGCPGLIALYSGWLEKAEEECFVVMLPSSSMDPRFVFSCWNMGGFASSPAEGNGVITPPCCCREAKTAPNSFQSYYEPNDTLFLKMAIDNVLKTFDANPSSQLTIDPDRVYMAGHSNGCMLALGMAAEYSETVAAVCCHAGTVITGFDFVYPSPVPIWMIHGKQDTLIPYDGGGPFWSVPDTMDYLATKNGCAEKNYVALMDDSSAVIGSIASGGMCDNNADVEIVTLDESGHVIFQGVEPLQGEPQTMVDTTTMAWDFCSAYSKAEPTLSPTKEPKKKAKKAAKKGKKA